MYICDRPITGARFPHNTEPDILRRAHSNGRGFRGERPDEPGLGADATQSAEAIRLAQEITKLAQRNAWTGVERDYTILEKMGDEAFNSIPSRAAIHQLGAQAAWILGETQLSQTRLLRAKSSLDTTSGSVDDKTLRPIIDSLDAIEKAYGAVTIAPQSPPTSNKERKRLQGHGPELIPVVQPFAPDQRRSIETAAKTLKDTGYFTGLLPAGSYTLAGQSLTVNVGTELTGQRRTNVVWGS
jgi:hypothetical protein